MRTIWRGCFLSILLCTAGAALAQSPEAEPARDADLQQPEVAPLVIDGRQLFEVNGVRAFPAAPRAEAIRREILKTADARDLDPATIVLQPGERYTQIMVGDRRIMRVTQSDAEIEGIDHRLLAEIYLERIRTAIADYRAARTHTALVSAAWRVGAATLLAALGLFLVLRSNSLLGRRIERRVTERLRAVTISTFEVVRVERLQKVARAVLRAVGTLALLAILYFYLRFVLGTLPWTRGAAARVDDWFLAPLKMIGEGLVHQLPSLLFLAVLFVLVRWVLGLVRLFFAAVGRGEVEIEGFDADWAEPTYKLTRIAIVAFAVVVAYPYIPGSSSAAFKGVSVFIGVVFSLSSSSTIANMIAGYSLTYRRAFRQGDRVKIGDVVGDVSHVRLQATYLRTIKNEEVVVPNSTVLTTEVVNFSTLAQKAGLILHTTVGIGYETPWRQVEAMLLESARRTEGLLAEPAPFVRLLALGDFAVTYEINAYCNTPSAMGPLYDGLHRNVLDVFNEYGVQIMTPAYEGDPEIPKVVPPEQWHLPPAPGPRANGHARGPAPGAPTPGPSRPAGA